MSWANSSKQSNADVLRAGDIMPPYNDKIDQDDNVRELEGSSEYTSLPQQKREIPRFDLAEEILAEQRKITAVKRKAPSPTREAGASPKREAGASPKREAGASKKDEPLGRDPALREPKQGQEKQVQSIGYAIEEPMPVLSEQQQIIAEVVAKDIERLCRGQHFSHLTL